MKKIWLNSHSCKESQNSRLGTLRILKKVNITSLHVHKKSQFLPWKSCRKSNIVDKVKTYVEHESSYTFFFRHATFRATPLFLFFLYLFNLMVDVLMFCQTNTFSTQGQQHNKHFSVSCISFGTSLYSVVAYLIKGSI